MRKCAHRNSLKSVVHVEYLQQILWVRCCSRLHSVAAKRKQGSAPAMWDLLSLCISLNYLPSCKSSILLFRLCCVMSIYPPNHHHLFSHSPPPPFCPPLHTVCRIGEAYRLATTIKVQQVSGGSSHHWSKLRKPYVWPKASDSKTGKQRELNTEGEKQS